MSLALYLLDPDPSPGWLPFAGVRPLAELRVGAHLVLSVSTSNGSGPDQPCPKLKRGTVETLIKTKGALKGRFAGIHDKGKATIYTYSVMRRAPVPYCIAYVTLAEGPTMMTNIVDCDLDAVRIGQAVKLVFKPSDGGPPVPMFTPA